MDNAWANLGGAIVFFILLSMSGCVGWCDYSGPGIKLKFDDKVHTLKLGHIE